MMLETSNREIRRAAEAEERRQREARRLSALVAALDDLLSELEELNLGRRGTVPDRCRQRAAELVAEAHRLDAPSEVPDRVANLMDLVYEAQEAAMLSRRRAGWVWTTTGAPDRPFRGDRRPQPVRPPALTVPRRRA
jgi:hypothetical protein